MNTKQDSLQFSTFGEFQHFLNYLNVDPTHLRKEIGLFVLADNIKNKTGGILCKEGAEIDARLFALLKNADENSPNTDLVICIQKSSALKGYLVNRLYESIDRVIATDAIKDKYGHSLLEELKEHILKIADNVFESSGPLYLIVDEDFFPNATSKNRRIVHSLAKCLRKSIFAAGLYMKHFEEPPLEELALTFLLVILLNFTYAKGKKGSDVTPGASLLLELFEQYRERLQLDARATEAVQFIINSHKSNLEFFEKDDIAARIACIIFVTDHFVKTATKYAHLEAGTEMTLESLYSLVRQEKLPKNYVDTLAHWIQEKLLFKFYDTLAKLENECERKNASPYPMNGFCSPTLFVCKRNDRTCPHLIGSSTPINLQTGTKFLRSGSYAKCGLLSQKIQEFYTTFYVEIKRESLNQLNTGKADSAKISLPHTSD